MNWRRRLTTRRILLVVDKQRVSRAQIERVNWSHLRINPLIMLTILMDGDPIRVYDIDCLPKADIEHIKTLIQEPVEQAQ